MSPQPPLSAPLLTPPDPLRWIICEHIVKILVKDTNELRESRWANEYQRIQRVFKHAYVRHHFGGKSRWLINLVLNTFSSA